MGERLENGIVYCHRQLPRQVRPAETGRLSIAVMTMRIEPLNQSTDDNGSLAGF